MRAKARVGRGVALLDEHKPGWEAAIDLGTFDLEYMDACVLGQVYGSYSEGLRHLGVTHNLDLVYGFNAITGLGGRRMHRVWVKVIAGRQRAALEAERAVLEDQVVELEAEVIELQQYVMVS